MAFVPGCDDEPGTWLQQRVCLSNLSKDVHGEIGQADASFEKCGEPQCVTLKTVNPLKVEVSSAPCDSELGHLLDGTLAIDRLVHQFQDDSTRRGRHAGDFTWFGGNTQIGGRISGITNAGVMRAPLPRECEECESPGTMRGRLCGVVTDAGVGELRECELFATYLLWFEDVGSEGIPAQAIVGTIEGVLVCPCRD